MNIYFSCSVTGGRADQQVYKAIVDHLLINGHEVPTAHLSDDDIMALEAMAKPQDVYQRGHRLGQWLRRIDRRSQHTVPRRRL